MCTCTMASMLGIGYRVLLVCYIYWKHIRGLKIDFDVIIVSHLAFIFQG